MGRKKGNKAGAANEPQQPGDQDPTSQPAQAPQSTPAGPSSQPVPAPTQAGSAGPSSAGNPPSAKPDQTEVTQQEQSAQQQPEEAPPPGEGGSKKKKKKKKGKGTAAETDADAQPPATAVPSTSGLAVPSTSGSAVPSTSKKDAGKGDTEKLAKEVENLSLVPTVGKYQIPARKQSNPPHSSLVCSRKIRIEVNYLPLTFVDLNRKLFHYDVTFIPEKPRSLFRPALQILLRRNCPRRHPAFDGRKNLYAAHEQLFPQSIIRDSVEIADPEDNNRMKTFDITIKLTDQEINMSQLKRYMDRGRTENIPQDVIQAVDIALRSQLYIDFIPCARSFFSGPANVDLARGMELYNGFFQSAIIGKNGAYLNVDVANKAFPNDQTVLQFLRRHLEVPEAKLTNGLEDFVCRELANYIKGLKVAYSVNDTERRTYKVNGLGLTARNHRFEHNGRQISVETYFRNERRITLRYPNLPLLHVGPPQRNTMIPLEFCRVIGNQVVMRKLDEKQTSNMVKAAAKPTHERKRRILENIQKANYARNEVLSRNEFGISVSDRFAQVDSYVFKAPTILYRNKGEVSPSNGEWRMDRQSFNQSNDIKSWAVLIKDGRITEDVVRDGLVKLLINCGKQCGLTIAQPRIILSSNGTRDQSEDTIFQNLENLNRMHGPLQIVVVVMPGGGPAAASAYSHIKRASELRSGVLTQCLKALTVSRKMNPMTAQNILLKMNAKVNGVNHMLGGPLKSRVFSKPVMFVGADVTHPAPGSENNPSIAAVAASFDRTCFKYKMMYALQGSRKEMIENLQDIMVEQLRYFRNYNNSVLPDKIIYYRDGVSEGQFRQVLDIELDAMRRACRHPDFGNYTPKITFMVVQKRHHTRFFPRREDGDGSPNNNVPAGTVVDTDITHPTELDFYLVSHKSIQGTARPTKYHLLFDDNEFECEELEKLTYDLCFLFSRCNRSVSYPAPTYYAHLGAFRARAYWDGQRVDLSRLAEEQRSRGTIRDSICQGTPMFFV